LIDSNSFFYGLHLDIEPHEDVLYRLFAEIKTRTSKPLTIAAGRFTPDTFRYTDMVVLMGYDWATSPEAFREEANQRIGAFFKYARMGDGKAMVGIPAIATHREYESIAAGPDEPRQATGHSMAAFVEGSRIALTDALAEGSGPYVGVCVWALHPEEGLHGGRDTYWYYPTTIDPEIWDMLQKRFP
jgi:hypothetical protein